jgi:GT2 family glycosyltransferase/tetratricopeptide (TPR) repeat protein
MSKEIGRYEQAAAAYRCALSRSPGDAELRMHLGQVFSLIEQTEQANEAYPEAERLSSRGPALNAERQGLEMCQSPSGSDPLSNDTECEVRIREGDRLRDERRFAEAAKAYQAALAMAPLRTDIRVQYANMLKDAGHLTEAEANYRQAATEKPGDPDVYLQLGHALKLQGKRTAALEAYHRAASLAPSSPAPQYELFKMGLARNQERLFEAQLWHGGIERLTELTHHVLKLQATLSRLIETLPDIQAQIAFPLGCYDRFRAIYDIPPPPRIANPPSFAILLLADREPLETMHTQIREVRSQTYREWRLHIVGANPARRRVAELAAAGDDRIRWSDALALENPAQAEKRVALSSGADWILFLPERALLHRRAIEWFASVVGHGAAKAFIVDEETMIRERGSNRRTNPKLRQVVDYDTLLEMNTFGETIAVEGATYAAVVDKLVMGSVSEARSSLLLSLVHDGTVGHIPCPLVCLDGQVSADVIRGCVAHETAVRGHLAEAALLERVVIGPQPGLLPRLRIRWRPKNPEEPLAVIIPTRDNGDDVNHLVQSMRDRATMPHALRIIIVDNGSRQVESRAILESLASKSWAQVIPMDEPFNWSRLNNRAAERAGCDLLVFANDDMVMLSDGWDETLRGFLGRPEIGAVGARLLYPDDTLQHAGIILGWNDLDIHDGVYEDGQAPGPANRWQVVRAVAAVDGAFLATRRELFLAHSEFDDINLPVAHADIDYALKLRASGLRILWTPDISLYHHESKTRGLEHLDPEKRSRAAVERASIEGRWGTAVAADPSINPLWHMATLPFRLISTPSQARLWAHIERCAAANPWMPEAGLHPDLRWTEPER